MLFDSPSSWSCTRKGVLPELNTLSQTETVVKCVYKIFLTDCWLYFSKKIIDDLVHYIDDLIEAMA